MNTIRRVRLAALAVALVIALALGFVTRWFALEPATSFGVASTLAPIVLAPLTTLLVAF